MAEYIEKWSVVNRLIDIENEFQQYKPFHGFEHAMYRKICEAEIAIGKTQAADVAPVVHGQWIIGVDNDDFDVKCSKCEWTDIFEVTGIAAVEGIAKAMHYCPNCGARMDGGANVWSVLEKLDAAPTVDAVEVVRCKDCKHQCKIWHADKRMKEKGYWIYSCKGNSDPFVSHTVNGYDDEYCCYGERKKEENDE